MKINDIEKTKDEEKDIFRDLKRDDKGNWSVVYNMYGGITCMISLTESEALWVSEIKNKIYREKFDKAFTEALQTFLFKELDKCDKEVLS
jgi:hypothetical protein